MSALVVIPAQAGIAPALRFRRINGDGHTKRDSRQSGNDRSKDPRQ